MDSYYIHEYIDEIRFSDVARYTDSFNVPNTPYGQAVTDNRTLTELIEDLEEEKQLKVLPTNIRNQITILGVTGNLIPGIDTSDANAIASDIVQDKTAYVNGEKLTGSMMMFNYSFSDLAEQGYDLSGKSEEDPFVLTVDENGLNIAPKMPDRLSLESGSYFPVGVSNLDIAEEANITSDKIVAGNTIFGVEGTATTGTGIDTSDATATADDIVMSKTAYAQGQKITGTMTQMDIPFSSLPDYGIDTSELTDGENFVQVNNDDTTVGVYAPMSLSVKANTYLPMTASNSDVAAAAGLTADKIVAGNTIFGIIGTGGTTEYESLNSIGTSVTSSSLLPESSFVTLSGTVNNTGIITEDITTFVAGETYSDLANTIGLTADKLVEGETVLGIAGTAKVGADIGDYYDLTPSSSKLKIVNLIKTIPEIDTSDVTTMNSMFSGCTNLVNIPLLNTADVTNMAAMFSSCSSLVSLPLLNTSNVTTMQDMFAMCVNLATIPVLNMNSVTSMSNMFYNCSSLTNESLNNILIMCSNTTNVYSGAKTLQAIGLTSAQAATCTTLSNYQAFLDAGWTTGY